MINKDSLLDAYLTLGGSVVMHFAMLITLFVVLGDPHVLDKEVEFGSELQLVYWISIIVHSGSFVVLGVNRFRKVNQFKIMQVLDVVIVFLNIFLMLICFETFALLQKESIENDDYLNPNMKFANQGKCHHPEIEKINSLITFTVSNFNSR